ncbi:hypothetical protein [Chryseobacterium bernardetii]|nr:hypothetical protein [Chryseobacterium bernardetii]
MNQDSSSLFSNDTLKIKVNDNIGSMTVILNLKNKNVEFNSVEKHL